MDRLEQITNEINALNEAAQQATEAARSGDKSVEEVKALIDNEIKPKLDALTADRERAIHETEIEALNGQVTELGKVIEEMREPRAGFAIGSVKDPEGKAVEDDPYFKGETPQRSVYADIKLANKGSIEARERLTKDIEVPSGVEGKALTEEGKAMTEGTGAQGGYLVRPQVERQLVEARELDNVLRSLCSSLNINTNQISLDQIGLSTTAGWVAELAQKPEATNMTLATITASIFTAAGLATISNQLLADSNPAVDGLVTSDLAKRLVALEETAFLTGTGTGQPLGILNTPGIGATPITVTDVSADNGLLDQVLNAILAVQTNHGQPTAIVMHPRTWTAIIKDRDASGHWTIGDPGNLGVRDVTNPRPASGTLFGVRVVLSNRVPTNLGAGTNESRVIVGDFREALILDRQGITVDESPHVYFTTNQTVFRAETRVGFTAARTPLAFNVIGGAGLANQ